MKLPSPKIYFISDNEAYLLEDYIIDTIIGKITIKRGFIFDGASIPAFAWSIIHEHPFSGKLLPAAIVHDILYRVHYVNYLKANDVWYDLCVRNKVAWGKRQTMTQVLNVVGWVAYNNNGKQKDIDYYKQFFEIVPN
jgi:AAA+ superfamily predicted ATPase